MAQGIAPVVVTQPAIKRTRIRENVIDSSKLPNESHSPPGEDEYTLADPVKTFFTTVRRLVTRPSGFFAGVDVHGGFGAPIVFAMICSVIGSLVQLALGPKDTGP